MTAAAASAAALAAVNSVPASTSGHDSTSRIHVNLGITRGLAIGELRSQDRLSLALL